MNDPFTFDAWRRCRNILCVRTDNMGDLVMSGPAIRLLKSNLGCRITLLTSKQGAPIAPFLPDVDEVITGHFPWVKEDNDSPDEAWLMIRRLREGNFDGAVIFTVYSQSALPAAMFLYLAGIPLRLAYAHENPYHLLTHWAADEEPFSLIRHQVERDILLLRSIGITGTAGFLRLKFEADTTAVTEKLRGWGLQSKDRFIILHPGVSEERRKYPVAYWKKILKSVSQQLGIPVILTGSAGERSLTDTIAAADPGAINAAGLLSMHEWIDLVSRAGFVISVNTATVHIAAALQRPVLVLYAMTNPQHTPWQTPHAVLPFSVPAEIKSRNPIVRFVDEHHYGKKFIPAPAPGEVIEALNILMTQVSRFPAVPS